jgi:hypothetical protein
MSVASCAESRAAQVSAAAAIINDFMENSAGGWTAES